MKTSDQLKIEKLKKYLAKCANYLETANEIIKKDRLSYDEDDYDDCIEVIKKARELSEYT